MDYLEKFNDTILELVDDLIRVFPGDSDFKMYKFAIQGAIIADPQIVQRVFRERICTVYGEKIVARDEEFFISNTYSDMKEEFSEAEQLISKLKGCWSGLTPAQRDVVWKYMRLLVMLDKKIVA